MIKTKLGHKLADKNQLFRYTCTDFRKHISDSLKLVMPEVLAKVHSPVDQRVLPWQRQRESFSKM